MIKIEILVGKIKLLSFDKVKLFKCKTCEYESRFKGNLKQHIEAVHEGIKPFKCDICDFKTAHESKLKKHTESVHRGIKPFKCSICDYKTGKKFRSKKTHRICS